MGIFSKRTKIYKVQEYHNYGQYEPVEQHGLFFNPDDALAKVVQIGIKRTPQFEIFVYKSIEGMYHTGFTRQISEGFHPTGYFEIVEIELE